MRCCPGPGPLVKAGPLPVGAYFALPFMRILYHHRIASKDGQITHIEEMVHALKDLGHEVRVVGPEVHQNDSGQGGSPGWVGLLKKYLPAALYELAEAAYAFVVYRRLMNAISAFKPDVVYERYSLYQPAGVWASRRTGIPLLLEVNAPYAISRRKYSTIALGGLADRCERYTFCGATRVFPVTQVLADMLVDMGVQRQRIRVVPNGINPKDFLDVPSTARAQAGFGIEGRMVIGFIGFVREWDQLDRIVTWLSKRPKDDPAMLLVVGDGPVRPELEAQAKRLGIAHKLRFTGVVPRSQVPAAAAAFDVALQTALVPYASPLCLFEYMALGKAILAPDQPNHHEVLVGGVDADLYDPADAQGIERRLDLLAADAALRARLGAGARQALTDRQYLWSGNAKRVADAAAEAVLAKANA
jgi:glycosyltransferase involved in cell wall biosynthesis